MNDMHFTQHAAELRRAFDQSFAQAVRGEAEPVVDLLAIRVGGDPYALRLAGLAGLLVDRLITHLPGGGLERLGLAGFRGATVPVYDLRVLLGYAASGVPRWLAVAAATPVALAFDTFEGHLRVPLTAIAVEQRGTRARPHVREIAHVADRVRPVLQLDSLLADIRQRVSMDLAEPDRQGGLQAANSAP